MLVADFRSDTVTRPTAAMREAMAHASVGDDVYGDDPTVNALQDRLAADLGFEAALFVPSGTQSNLIALMAHCQRGDEYIVGSEAHTFKYEAGGAAVLGSIQPQPVPQAADGTLPLDAVKAAIKPDDVHFARSRVLCLENTWHGQPLPRGYAQQARALCDAHGLALHLDGARLFNAAIAQGVEARELTAPFHSVSVCLSKGLGAPVGSVLLGSAALIAQAKRLRKLLGGGWRQAGLLAAAACTHWITTWCAWPMTTAARSSWALVYPPFRACVSSQCRRIWFTYTCPLRALMRCARHFAMLRFWPAWAAPQEFD